MVALDLDGTLLNDRKELTTKNIMALSELRARNIEIVVATGRRYRTAKKLTEKIEFPLTIISSSGSLAMNTLGDIRIMASYLDESIFYSIVKEGRKNGLYPLLHVDHFEERFDFLIEFEKDAPCYRTYLADSANEHRNIGDLMKYTGGRVLLMCYMGSMETVEKFEIRLRERFGDGFHSHIITTLKKIGPVLEIMSPSGNKWGMLREYARLRNIAPGQIIAIGDDNNDIEMIRNSGLGVAMKNATGKVKAGAKLVSGHTNDEDGVARIVSAIFDINFF